MLFLIVCLEIVFLITLLTIVNKTEKTVEKVIQVEITTEGDYVKVRVINRIDVSAYVSTKGMEVSSHCALTFLAYSSVDLGPPGTSATLWFRDSNLRRKWIVRFKKALRQWTKEARRKQKNEDKTEVISL